jgi:MEKHLA domain
MTTNYNLPIYQQESVIKQSLIIIKSYRHWTGKDLIDTSGTDQEIAERLFKAHFPVLSHTNVADPIFNYGNKIALELWELDWTEFTQLPSRKSAEPIEQTERDRILKTCKEKGICNWSGVRISSTGKRYLISNGLLWNLLDENQQFCGQSATYYPWENLN